MSANSPEMNAERLLKLSNEVHRIAGSLAQLSTLPGPALQSGSGREVQEVTAEQVSSVIRARRRRDSYFSSELFADPAWDMMLELFRCELSQQRISTSSLCIAAAVPATTALRWISTLVSNGLIARRADPYDGRRVYVELTSNALEAMRRYFSETGAVLT